MIEIPDFLIHYHESKTSNYWATDNPKCWRPTTDPNILFERSKIYEYKYNSQCFRCDEFTEHSELPILFLGCSNTCGVALELENTWPYILLNEIKNYTGKKIPLWNLAMPGSSIDEQALHLSKYIDQLKPKIIFFLIPSVYRRLFLYEKKYIQYLPSRGGNWRPDESALFSNLDNIFSHDTISIFESYKNLLLINWIAKFYDCKIYYNSWTTSQEYSINELASYLSQFEFLDLGSLINTNIPARDLMHYGKELHKWFALKTFEKMKHNL